MRRRVWLLLVAAAWLIAGPALAVQKASPDEAATFIQSLGEEALSVLGESNGSLAQREAQVRDLLSRSFDLKTIGRFVLGQSWKRATPAQRSEYQQVFSQFVLYTYSRRLGGYSGESFKIVEHKPAGKRDALVTTRINRPSGPPLLASWRVRRVGDQHKIIDVVVEGASMVIAQRSEFKAVVQRQGIDGLIESLRLKVAKYSVRES